MTPTRPALRYHGGKFKIAPWIISFFPKHLVYVEPYGGGASILLAKDRVSAECYNDLDSLIVRYFRVLRDIPAATELHRRVALTPYAREELAWSYEPAVDEVDEAHKLVIRSFMGFGSDATTRGYTTGFRAKMSDGRALPAQSWSSWHESIPAFTSRLQGVLIENMDALELIQQLDTPAALFFVDPPYCHSARSSAVGKHGYRYEMDDAAHEALASVLHQVKGMVVLSGYPTDLYDSKLYVGWERHQRLALADGAKVRTEVVWLNPACSRALQLERSQQNLFAEVA